jgi:hypothetical protein
MGSSNKQRWKEYNTKYEGTIIFASSKPEQFITDDSICRHSFRFGEEVWARFFWKRPLCEYTVMMDSADVGPSIRKGEVDWLPDKAASHCSKCKVKFGLTIRRVRINTYLLTISL